MKRVISLALAGAFVTLTAWGDVRFISKTWQEGGTQNDAASMTVDGWVDGPKCDLRFTESGNPFMQEGTRLVCGEGKLYLVNDKDKTVSEWDLDAMFESIGNVMENLGGMMKISVENAKVETLLKEDGGTIAGHPTTHYRFLTEYDLSMKIMGMNQGQHVRSIQDGWYTTALDDEALGVWLMRDPPDFGDSGLGDLMELEKSKAKGWPLKTIIEQVTVDQRGREQTTRTITEVTELSEGSPPSGTYRWGADYQQVNMMPDLSGMNAQQGGDGEKEEKKGGWRSLLKRGGGGE